VGGRLNDLLKKSTKQCILIPSAMLLYCDLRITHFFHEHHKRGVTIRIYIWDSLTLLLFEQGYNKLCNSAHTTEIRQGKVRFHPVAGHMDPEGE